MWFHMFHDLHSWLGWCSMAPSAWQLLVAEGWGIPSSSTTRWKDWALVRCYVWVWGLYIWDIPKWSPEYSSLESKWRTFGQHTTIYNLYLYLIEVSWSYFGTLPGRPGSAPGRVGSLQNLWNFTIFHHISPPSVVVDVVDEVAWFHFGSLPKLVNYGLGILPKIVFFQHFPTQHFVVHVSSITNSLSDTYDIWLLSAVRIALPALIKTTSVCDVVRRKVLALLLCEPLSIHLKRDVGPAWAGFMWRPEMSFGVSSYFQSKNSSKEFCPAPQRGLAGCCLHLRI